MRFRRRAAIGLAAAVIAAASFSAAWACVPGGGGSGKKLTLNPPRVRPGEPVTVRAPASVGGAPIELRLDAADGLVLATLGAGQLATDGETAAVTFTVPADAAPGQHAVIAVQAGAKWDAVALAVTLPDGSVPDASYSLVPGRADGGGLAPMALGVVAAGAAAVAAAGIALLRRSKRAATTAAPPA